MMNLFSMWRSTRVLDGRKVGSADRSQSVVHALLSARDQVPLETPSPLLRRRIAQRIEDTRPFTPGAGEAWLASSVRGGVLALVLLGSAGVVIWGTNNFGGSLPGTLAKQPVDHDDPDPDLMTAMQSGTTPAPARRAEALVEPKREHSGLASVQPTPEQEQARKDFEQLASTFMQSLPVRQNEPR